MNTDLMNNVVNGYFALAILYNVLNLTLNDLKGRMLAPTEPVSAIMMMTLFYLVYAGGAVLDPVARTALLILFMLLVLRFGIYRHLAGYDEEQYFSRCSWATAIAINVFGVCALALSLWIK